MFLDEIDEELSLRLIDISDAEQLFLITDNSREHLREWLRWVDLTVSIADKKYFIQHSKEEFSKRKSLTTVIIYRNQLVGNASFHSINWTNKIGMIGYWLDKDFQGLGIMTRAVRALIDYGFSELGLNRIEIRAAFENEKSRAIPERLGFVKEGQIRQAEWLYDHYVDHVVYGMLASDWSEMS